MALWLDAGAEPLTEKEKADLDAISALKESTAIELKEKGNEYVKMGKKHYRDAIDCYTRSINQKALGEAETSILYSNRAHVNLLLGNNRRALEDADEAIKLSPTNAKAFYRAAKASLVLDFLKEATIYCERGLEVSPNNEDLKKLASQANAKLVEREKREAEASKALIAAKELLSAIDDRGVKVGKAMYRELTGLKKPFLDKNKILHWPVLLLYAEVMSSDLIEDFCETDMFSSHLDVMFSEDCPPLPWDKDNAYTRENIELYFEVGSSVCLSKSEILRYLLEGTAGAKSVDEDNTSADHRNPAGRDPSRWVKVNEKRTLHDVLKEPNFVIPEIPVFYVVSKQSSFYDKFKSGEWAICP
ncbi:hypothetical protein RND81_05G216500 [Saponaria officinalis]|uniref:Cns1/TTC4 wheel domain-containing protein n=1 Tax=Saponaria officinalis TaxID=3572 RepID=A0AAW1L2Y5_SAPOF